MSGDKAIDKKYAPRRSISEDKEVIIDGHWKINQRFTRPYLATKH